MDILSEIFSSATLVKIMRLFFLSPEDVFEVRDIAGRVQAPSGKVRKEMFRLKKIKFIFPAVKEVIIEQKRNFHIRKKKRKIKGWRLNPGFLLYRPLKTLLLNAAPVARGDFLRKLKKAGRLQLVILSGFFLTTGGENEQSIDLLVVGDGIKRGAIDSAVRFVESKIGRELNYTALTTKEFQYRREMHDKFIRDILDYPHEKLLNKLGV